MHLTNQRSGQSLLEAVIAIGVILVSTISATTVIVSTIGLGQASENRIVAVNLAREGIEIVRGVRDSNWQKRSQNETNSFTGGVIYAWNDSNLAAPTTLADSTTPVAGNNFISNYSASKGMFLDVASGGDYKVYTTGAVYYQKCAGSCTASPYSRTITVQYKTETPAGFTAAIPYLLVTSRIDWNNHGAKTYSAIERLYDWR